MMRKTEWSPIDSMQRTPNALALQAQWSALKSASATSFRSEVTTISDPTRCSRDLRLNYSPSTIYSENSLPLAPRIKQTDASFKARDLGRFWTLDYQWVTKEESKDSMKPKGNEDASWPSCWLFLHFKSKDSMKPKGNEDRKACCFLCPGQCESKDSMKPKGNEDTPRSRASTTHSLSRKTR